MSASFSKNRSSVWERSSSKSSNLLNFYWGTKLSSNPKSSKLSLYSLYSSSLYSSSFYYSSGYSDYSPPSSYYSPSSSTIEYKSSSSSSSVNFSNSCSYSWIYFPIFYSVEFS